MLQEQKHKHAHRRQWNWLLRQPGQLRWECYSCVAGTAAAGRGSRDAPVAPDRTQPEEATATRLHLSKLTVISGG